MDDKGETPREWNTARSPSSTVFDDLAECSATETQP